MNRSSNLLWGLLLVVLGIILGFNVLEITNINIFFDGWWTLFIIVPCFIDLFKDKDKIGNIVGLIIGICLLLGCQDILRFEVVWKLILPVILVAIGVSFIFKDVINSKVNNKVKELNRERQNIKEYWATFGGQDVNFANEEFQSCNLTAIFGGVKCDLREAIIKEDSIINISSIFGGVSIYVPDNIKVNVSSIPIFGGVSDERKNITKDGKITIYINATCVFGGVQIR